MRASTSVSSSSRLTHGSPPANRTSTIERQETTRVVNRLRTVSVSRVGVARIEA